MGVVGTVDLQKIKGVVNIHGEGDHEITVWLGPFAPVVFVHAQLDTPEGTTLEADFMIFADDRVPSEEMLRIGADRALSSRTRRTRLVAG